MAHHMVRKDQHEPVASNNPRLDQSANIPYEVAVDWTGQTHARVCVEPAGARIGWNDPGRLLRKIRH